MNLKQISEDKKIEKQILKNTTRIVALFHKLSKQHPSEIPDAINAIHKLQLLIGMRIARRHEPTIFPIKN